MNLQHALPAQRRGLVEGLLRRPSVWFGLIGTVVVVSAMVVSRRPVEPLPVLSTVPPFEFTNQQGQPFGTKALTGRVWVANFIFTRCPTICPTFTAKMAAIQTRSPEGLQLVSFTVDPEYDSPEKLAAYATKHGAGAQWSFLTASREALSSVIVNGLLQPMDAPLDPANLASLVHGSYFALVDQQMRVRGVYEFNQSSAVDQVLRDAQRLLTEPRL